MNIIAIIICAFALIYAINFANKVYTKREEARVNQTIRENAKYWLPSYEKILKRAVLTYANELHLKPFLNTYSVDYEILSVNANNNRSVVKLTSKITMQLNERYWEVIQRRLSKEVERLIVYAYTKKFGTANQQFIDFVQCKLVNDEDNLIIYFAIKNEFVLNLL